MTRRSEGLDLGVVPPRVKICFVLPDFSSYLTNAKDMAQRFQTDDVTARKRQ